MSKFIKAIRALAKMKALDADSAEKLLNAHVEEQDGGPGSGNFGHAGRPGKKGGSAPGEGGGGGGRSSQAKPSGGQKSAPMSFTRGETPELLKKAESPEGLGLGDVIKYMGKPIKLSEQSKKWMDNINLNDPIKHGAYSRWSPPATEEEKKKFEELNKKDPFEGWTENQKNQLKQRLEKEKKDREEYQNKIAQGPPSQRFMPDPVPFRGTKEQAVAHYDLDNNLVSTADWCFEEKKKYPPDSFEYKAYEEAENLANHSYKRPNAADSAEMIQERLSNISSQLKPYAVERYKKDMQNEPQITKDVCDIADALGVQMSGLENRTKTAGVNKDGVCRIQQKIEQDLAEAEAKAKKKHTTSTLTYEQCVDDLNDMVRYTQLGTEKNLVQNYEKTRKMLEDKGYKVVKVKNFYNVDPMENPYRGLTCVFESPTGTKFEFQFHTPRSLAAKNAMHPIYEEDRKHKPEDPDYSEEKHQEYQARMRNVSTREKVPYPVGIEKIQTYPPKKL